MWDLEAAEAALDGCDQQIANYPAEMPALATGDQAMISRSGVDNKDNAHHFASMGMDLQMIRAPEEVGVRATTMPSCVRPGRGAVCF